MLKKAKNKAPAVNQNKPLNALSGKTTEPALAKNEVTFFQAKLQVNEPGDQYEQEADRVAESYIKEQRSDSPFFTDNKKVSRKTDENVQRQGLLPDIDLQRTENSSSTFHPASDFSSRLDSSNGNGAGLAEDIRMPMENHLNADLGSVKVHNDQNAADLNSQINAKAFTHGQDVFFNEGEYNPDSDEGQRLIAHELTHTVQQGGASVKPQLIQREGDESSASEDEQPPIPSNEFSDDEVGSINTGSGDKKMTIPAIGVPPFKTQFGPSTQFKLPVGGVDREGTHIEAWETAALSGAGFTSAFNAQMENQNAPNLMFEGKRIYYLVLKSGSGASSGSGGVIFGDQETIKRRISRPYWNNQGSYIPHDVDHKKELQLGGNETATDNLWMLEASANRSSGSMINSEIGRRIRAVLNKAPATLIDKPNEESVRDQYEITVENGVSAGENVAGNPDQNWDLDKVQSGDHLEGLKFLTESEVSASGLRGSPDELVLFTNQTGGLPIRIPWDEAAQQSHSKDGLSIYIGRTGGGNTIINSVQYNPVGGEENQGGSGTILCTVFPGSHKLVKEKQNLAFSIQPIAGVAHGGYITKGSIQAAIERALEFEGMSPIQMEDTDLDNTAGLVGRGKILPTLPIFKDIDIELVIDAQGVRIRKLFDTGDFNLPSPFEVTNSSLEVYAGTGGLGINGEVNFEITNVGEGFLRAGANTSAGFSLAGGFDFDSGMFNPARIEVGYENGEWSILGTIGIPPGKVNGIKNATITAAYAEGTFNANGEATLDIPGVEQGTLEASFGEEGWSIGGSFNLSGDVPGIRSGSVEASISQNAGDEGYQITASGTAQPDIPGIDSSLSISYDNGIITMSGSAAYSRGMLSGQVNVGVTNSEVGADNQPTGVKSENLIVYGGGSLTLTLTPWLQATAGIQFLPNGEMVVSGRIGLPGTVDVFDRKEFERTLFRAPTLQIPIFAIPLGPRSIGLVATISGGLSLSAGFGPGQLQELFGEITYNPDRPEETTLHGGGRFVIPADAGLTLSADVGIGASVAIASVTGGIELAGTLGLEGEAAAEVDVNWTPTEGIILDASGSITVNPKFTFEVNALLRASLDLFVTSISEEWRYNLAAFSWGPDIQFGVRFPIHYAEGEPFDISFDDVEFIYPDIDIPNMAKGLAMDVKDSIL